jgi:hypothetical protein
MKAAKKAAPRNDLSHCLCTLANNTNGICKKNKKANGIICVKIMAAINTAMT